MFVLFGEGGSIFFPQAVSNLIILLIFSLLVSQPLLSVVNHTHTLTRTQKQELKSEYPVSVLIEWILYQDVAVTNSFPPSPFF